MVSAQILRSAFALNRHHPPALANHARARIGCHQNNVTRQYCCQGYCHRLGTSYAAVPLERRILVMSKDNIVTNLFRCFSESSIQHGNDDRDRDIKHTSNASAHRRGLLKYGRARRKWESKKREDSISPAKAETSTSNSSGESDATDEKNTNEDKQKADETKDDANNEMFGIPMKNPIRERYLRSQQVIIYPKTWSGWKALTKRAWTKYLWTFEGFLLAEKNKLDANGNLIPIVEEENDESAPSKEEKSLKDKATDTATDIASNVQKNISTIKEETPQLLKMGQKITGVSSKEELREWIGAQLRLGTACLSEFMKGYRKGRDEEVDRMLHQYFKDLDEKTEPDEVKTDENFENDVTVHHGSVNRMKRAKRTWGRRERRRLKAMGGKVETTPVESAALH